jgi:pimeloyl-ACP methyl ester carboxylesterase
LLFGGIRSVLNNLVRLSPYLAGNLTYDILSRPRRWFPETEEQRGFLARAQYEKRRLDGEQIHCYHWPGGPRSVLLAHGWESGTARWEPLGALLHQAGYTLYALDAPAHGESGGAVFTAVHYARVLAPLLEEWQPDFLVGHSAGGMSLSYALTQLRLAYRPRALVLQGVPAELADFIHTFQQTLGLSDAVIDALNQAFIYRAGWPFSAFSVAGYCREFDFPGLIIHDRYDELAPYSGARRMAANWAQGELLTTEGLGHALQGSEVNRATMAVLERWG